MKLNAECCYAECHFLNVIVLSAALFPATLSVVRPCVAMLTVEAPFVSVHVKNFVQMQEPLMKRLANNIVKNFFLFSLSLRVPK
jgi:hypothetical protein